MGIRNPWTCDCGKDDCVAVSERSRPVLLDIACLAALDEADDRDPKKFDYDGLPLLVEILARGKGRMQMSARCLPELIPLLLAVSGSTYPLKRIEERVRDILQDIHASIPSTRREGVDKTAVMEVLQADTPYKPVLAAESTVIPDDQIRLPLEAPAPNDENVGG